MELLKLSEVEAMLCQAHKHTILSGGWSERECRNPVAFFGKRNAVLHEEKCPLYEALASIAADEHDTQIGIGTDRFCMYAIPSQLAYRSQKTPTLGGFGDRFLERAKVEGDSSWLVVRNQHISMGSFWFTHVPASAHNFGCLAEHTAGSNGVGQRVQLIDPAKADFGAIRRWLALCEGNHGRLCNPPMHTRPLPKGFVVINCDTRKLEPLPVDAKFAALSYVWGANTSTSNASDSVSMFPQTMEHHRYCVTQQECPEKHEQIQNMHEIYREADLAIISAAGDGPHYGLPGISTPRTKVPLVDVPVGPRRMVSTGTSAQGAIRGSVWASRAWIYQEGLVSRRKLIFSDQQIYLHCMELEFRETIVQDYSLLTQSDNEDLVTPFQCRILHLIPQKNGLQSVYWLIQDFAQRKITFLSDTLNALVDVLNFFKEAFPSQFCHIWGQPIPYDKNSSMGDVVASALDWQMTVAGGRRPGFPSWSWIGWTGIVCPMAYEPYKEDIKASLVLNNGNIVEDASVFEEPSDFKRLSAKLSRYLIVEADTVDVRVQQKAGEVGDYINIWEPSFVKNGVDMGEIADAKGVVLTQDVKKGDGLCEDLQAGQTWLGIVLPNAVLVLVLKNMGDYCERIGYVGVKFSDYGKRPEEYLLERKKVRLG
ncbi:hypothetical protein FGRMN_3808 [Fusarium graminum]|nr:hypothetical protein FGRMN_3808 [Fusarium graminum]